MSGLLQRHALHLIPLAVPLVATAVILLPDRATGTVGPSRRSRRLLLLAAAASLGAAAIHLLVTPEHFEESPLYGGFFLLTALAQVACGLVLVRRPLRLLVGAVLVSNSGLVLLWLLTRTAGIPLGPEQGVVEPVGVLDLMAISCELALVAACTALLRLPAQVPARDATPRPAPNHVVAFSDVTLVRPRRST
jgi:hypothetical protein